MANAVDPTSVATPTSNPGTGIQNYAALNNTGGENTHVLQVGEIPKHIHELDPTETTSTAAATTTVTIKDHDASETRHQHSYQKQSFPGVTNMPGGGLGNSTYYTGDPVAPGGGDFVLHHTMTSSSTTITGNTGDGTTTGLKDPADEHENRQPYIVLIQLIKT